MRSRIESDIRGWDAIADHRTGTEGDQVTADWLADAVRAAGAEPRLESFAFERRALHECAVTCGERRAEGVPLFDGGLTDAAGLAAPLAPLEETKATAPASASRRSRRGVATRRRDAWSRRAGADPPASSPTPPPTGSCPVSPC